MFLFLICVEGLRKVKEKKTEKMVSKSKNTHDREKRTKSRKERNAKNKGEQIEKTEMGNFECITFHL